MNKLECWEVFFFLSFALVQIPLGILLDKFNPLKIIILMLIIIYLGTIIFFANSYEQIFLQDAFRE